MCACYSLVAVMMSVLFLFGCEQAAEPANDPDAGCFYVERPYDAARGGVQITAIYFDQSQNRDTFSIEDEWMVLESAQPASIKGWHMDAGDAGQQYALPDSLHRRLVIYTRGDAAPPGDTVMTLELNRWIWNNSDPDTARVYNADGDLMDIVVYKRCRLLQ